MTMYHDIIDNANDKLLYRRFDECIDLCNHHLQELKKADNTEISCLAREGLCVIACQAYAELDRWQEVLPFVTQVYDGLEDCPVKIVRLVLLLHAQMKDFATCSAISNIWLRNPNNFSNVEYPMLVEIYVSNVLIAADRWQEITQFVDACPGLDSEKRDLLMKQVRNLQALKEQATIEDITEATNTTQETTHEHAQESRLQGFISDFSDGPFNAYVKKVCEWVKGNMSTNAVYFIRNLALIGVILYYLLTKMSWDLLSWQKLAGIWAAIARMWKSMFAPFHLVKH